VPAPVPVCEGVTLACVGTRAEGRRESGEALMQWQMRSGAAHSFIHSWARCVFLLICCVALLSARVRGAWPVESRSVIRGSAQPLKPQDAMLYRLNLRAK